MAARHTESHQKRLARLCRAALVIAAAFASTSAATQANPRLDSALLALEPQRPGVVDAYVVVVALDNDPVFGREAREAGRVLERRFDAAGRTLVLASDEGDARAGAAGSPEHLEAALARAAQLMDVKEDVLILYSTSHGLPGEGLLYKDTTRAIEEKIAPRRFANLLEPHGFTNRLLMIQACYSGQFVPALASPGTVVITAAAGDRPSFGCDPGNDWTLFGDALVNRALREPAPLIVQLGRATGLIKSTEMRNDMLASNPQLSIGHETSAWIAELDRRAPLAASKPVGRPLVDVSF
ncbi:MAG: C13 family peptidase [Sphingomicrobium sp.]